MTKVNIKRESTVIFHKNMDGDICTPDKVIGPEGKQFKIWTKKYNEKHVSRIEMDIGFDWRESMRPTLPGKPDWCQNHHFGYIESGKVLIKMKDSDEIKTLQSGETYYIPPGHIPIIEEKCTMIEFSENISLHNKKWYNNILECFKK